MAKFDVFVTMLDVEHAIVEAKDEQEAREKVDHYIDHLIQKDIMDPGDLMNANIEIRPVEWNRLEGLE
ncbi:MAG: hypothetical protein GX685_04670 [Clostridiales bacterium]|nr:hypothetical protein [Clostridiales bacterium]